MNSHECRIKPLRDALRHIVSMTADDKVSLFAVNALDADKRKAHDIAGTIEQGTVPFE